MDREASHDAVHGVTKSRTQLSDWSELSYNPIKICNLLIMKSGSLLIGPFFSYHFLPSKMWYNLLNHIYCLLFISLAKMYRYNKYCVCKLNKTDNYDKFHPMEGNKIKWPTSQPKKKKKILVLTNIWSRRAPWNQRLSTHTCNSRWLQGKVLWSQSSERIWRIERGLNIHVNSREEPGLCSV